MDEHNNDNGEMEDSYSNEEGNETSVNEKGNEEKVRWFFQDYRGMRPYSKEESDLIEKHFQEKQDDPLKIRKYLIFVNSRYQQNENTGSQKKKIFFLSGSL